MNAVGDLKHVALAVWATAWMGAVGAYLFSVAADQVPGCFPHLAGCASVSAAGRLGWGYFVFKAMMLPSAAFAMIYWLICFHWLRLMGGGVTAIDRAIVVLGITGAIFLVLYATFLGSSGDTYRLMRRYGTVVYFGFTYLAQLLLSYRARSLGITSPIVSWKVGLGLGMLIGGLILAVLINFVEDDDHLENISEWNFATALTFYPVLTWLLWRQTGFRVRFELGD
ncbi:MAG: hypothetical protein O7G86_15070 [Gammaproteobacteria bacterium]|nr:hypothetical protein [Gammaproteobacteria bacterium]